MLLKSHWLIYLWRIVSFVFYDYFTFFLHWWEREEESERKRESSHKWIKALTFTVTICVHNIYLVMFVISKSGPEFKCHLTWPIVGIYRGIMLRRPQLSIGAERSISQCWQGVYKIQYWLTDWQDYFFEQPWLLNLWSRIMFFT